MGHADAKDLCSARAEDQCGKLLFLGLVYWLVPEIISTPDVTGNKLL
jgi:hypothetical protein